MTEFGEPNAAIAPTRNPGIDLLRGISIVLVVLHHVGLRIPLNHGVLASFLPTRLLNSLIYNGYEAVFIFFVISGFLIASNSLARWGRLSDMHVRTFYVRRASRILPCLFVLVAVLSVLHLVGAKDYVIFRPNQTLPRTILSAFGLHLNWYEGQTGWLPGNWDVLWSLSIEEVFYLCFPLLCIGLRRERFLFPALVLLAFSLPVSRAAIAGNEIWQEKAYLPGMAGIAMGILGALIAIRIRPRKRWIFPILFTMGFLGLLAVLCYGDELWSMIGNGAYLLLTLSALCLTLAFHWQAQQSKSWTIPCTGWLRSFGRLSYEVYLTHMFVVFTVARFFRLCGAKLWWGILWYLPALVITWMLGWIVARYISVPCERSIRQLLLKNKPSPCNNTLQGKSRIGRVWQIVFGCKSSGV